MDAGMVEPGSCQRPGPVSVGLQLTALLHSVCQPAGEVWKSHQQKLRPRPGWNPGGQQHQISKQMAFHDGITI